MRASEFHEEFGDDEDFWGEDSEFPVSDWQSEVSNDDTRLGYWDWVVSQRESKDDEDELEAEEEED